jgi:hypothetical protein
VTQVMAGDERAGPRHSLVPGPVPAQSSAQPTDDDFLSGTGNRRNQDRVRNKGMHK